jgi:hypothetical protein
MKRGMNGQKTKGSQSRRDKKYSPKGRGVYKHMDRTPIALGSVCEPFCPKGQLIMKGPTLPVPDKIHED